MVVRCPQRPSPREVLRWIRAADRVFGGHTDIVNISLIYCRFRGPSDRLDIFDISKIYRRYLAICNICLCYKQGVQAGCQGAREAQAVRAAIHVHNAVYINKLKEPDLMQHHGSLRDRRHGRAKGPWGARGRLTVTKRWPWSSRRPIHVQRRVTCCILAHGTMKWHRVGSWGPWFVACNPPETPVRQWKQTDT